MNAAKTKFEKNPSFKDVKKMALFFIFNNC